MMLVWPSVLLAVFEVASGAHLRSRMRTVNSSQATEWDCNRPWPSLALFLSVKLLDDTHNPEYYEFENIFLRTFLLFWPRRVSNTSLLLGYDAELKDHRYLKELRQMVNSQAAWRVPGGISLAGMDAVVKHGSGHARLQYDMFWADNYTSPDTEYIGFVGTNTAFITYVDREDLFEDGKPVVNVGTEWLDSSDPSAAWSKNFNSTGMPNFPMIVKRSHLAEIREWLRRHWNATTFDGAYRDHIDPANLSQFAIFCTYMWNYRRDEYKWYVYNGIDPPPTSSQVGNAPQQATVVRVPKPRIAMQAASRSTKVRYMPRIGDAKHYSNYADLLRRGYCYSPPFPKAYGCGDIDPLRYYAQMHNLALNEQTPDKAEMDQQAHLRHQRLAKCDHDWEEWEITTLLNRPNQ